MNTTFRLASTTALVLALAAGSARAQGNESGAAPHPEAGPGMMAPAGSANSGAATGSAGMPGPTVGGGAQGAARPMGWGRGYPPGAWMMGGGYGPGPSAMGGGWRGPQMRADSGGYGRGPWMMGGAEMGPWMTGSWMMGPWMTGPWMTGRVGYGPCGGPGQLADLNLNLSVGQVRTDMQRWLGVIGNPHIKLGDVAEKGPDMITAEIVTTDKGGLVQRYDINRHTGFVLPAGE